MYTYMCIMYISSVIYISYVSRFRRKEGRACVRGRFLGGKIPNNVCVRAPCRPVRSIVPRPRFAASLCRGTQLIRNSAAPRTLP